MKRFFKYLLYVILICVILVVIWFFFPYNTKPSAIVKTSSGNNYSFVLNDYQNRFKTDSANAAIYTLSEYLYTMHSFRLASKLIERKVPVYVYRFDYAKGFLGAGHATELPFVWYHPLTVQEPLGEQGQEIMRKALKGAEP